MCEVCKVKRHAWYNLVWVSLILWPWLWLWLRLLCWNCQSILGNLRAGGERGENNCPAATRSQSSPCPQWTMSTSSDQKHPVSLSVPSHRLRFDPSSNIWDNKWTEHIMHHFYDILDFKPVIKYLYIFWLLRCGTPQCLTSWTRWWPPPTHGTTRRCVCVCHSDNMMTCSPCVQMTVLQQAHLYVDQLRREANKTRINVSEAIQDMMVK